MPRDTPARRKIRVALRALGYEPREIKWEGPWVPVDFGSDGGFSVDGFGSFSSAADFVQWVGDPGNFATFVEDTRNFTPRPSGEAARDDRTGGSDA